MDVLITGITGRVGANVAAALLARGWAVRGLVMPGDTQAAKLKMLEGVRVFEGSLRDQEAINTAMAGATHVIHLAAQLIRGNTPVDAFYDINAFGTLRLLEAFVKQGGKGGRFVLASTDGTYCPGAPPSVPLAEDAPQLPADYYGTSKLLGEHILFNHAKQYDVPYSIVRFATVVSPEEAPKIFRFNWMRTLLQQEFLERNSHLWPLFAEHKGMAKRLEEEVGDRAANNPAVSLAGPDGEPWSLHLADVRDVVQGVLLALDHPAALGEAFNIAGPDTTTLREGARVASELLGLPSIEVRLPLRWQLDMDISKAKRLLGYAPKWSYEQVMRNLETAEAIPALLANPQ
ncbi:MAG: NAD(P)-dependent oxidoreductase [Hyphomicrobiales bacterium]|nr:MAG: NAD(P)-dependent oxidoreductase [Hyphomicrobiales bacterium]